MNIFKRFKRFVKNIFKRKKKKLSKTSELRCYIHDLSSYIEEGSLDILEKMKNEPRTIEDNSDAEITGIINKNFNMDEADKRNLKNEHFMKENKSLISEKKQNVEGQKQEYLILDVLNYRPIDENQIKISGLKSNDNSNIESYKIKENNDRVIIPSSFGNQHSAQKVDHDVCSNKNTSRGSQLKHQQYFPEKQDIGHFEDSPYNSESENRRIKSKSKFSQNSLSIKDPPLCRVEYIDTLASDDYAFPLKKAKHSIKLISDKFSERNDSDGGNLNEKAKQNFNYSKPYISCFETESLLKTNSQESFRWGRNSLRENTYGEQNCQRTGEEIFINHDKYTDDNNSPETYSSSLHQRQKPALTKENFNISHAESASDFGMKGQHECDMKIFLNDKRGAYNRLLSTFGANRDCWKSINETSYSQYLQKSPPKLIKYQIQNPDGMNNKDDKITMNAIKRQLGLDTESSEENDIKMEKVTLIDLTDKVEEVSATIDCLFKDQRTLSAPILKLSDGINKFKVEKTIVRDYTDGKFYTKLELVSVCNIQKAEVSQKLIKLEKEEDEETINELIDSTLNELMEKLLKLQSNKKMHKQVENVVEEALITKYSSIFCDENAAKEMIQGMIKKANVRKRKDDSSID